tara:strand:- start:569 stop:847 length:279 start_codon:yes stop_codon:yes gene_type:complete
LTDSFVQDQTLNEDTNQVIIDQVSWKTQVAQTLGKLHAIRENLSITHFHTEQWSFVFHADMLGSISQRKMTEIWQVVEDDTHVQVTQKLTDF